MSSVMALEVMWCSVQFVRLLTGRIQDLRVSGSRVGGWSLHYCIVSLVDKKLCFTLSLRSGTGNILLGVTL